MLASCARVFELGFAHDEHSAGVMLLRDVAENDARPGAFALAAFEDFVERTRLQRREQQLALAFVARATLFALQPCERPLGVGAVAAKSLRAECVWDAFLLDARESFDHDLAARQGELTQGDRETIAAQMASSQLVLVPLCIEDLDAVEGDGARFFRFATLGKREGGDLGRHRVAVLHAGESNFARIDAESVGKRAHHLERR